MTKSQKQNLAAAFKELRTLGYFAEQDHTCCNTCGWAEVPLNKKKVVFYHLQSGDDLKENSSCGLNWEGNATEIMSVFNKHGVETSWDGDENHKIQITLPKD